MYAIVDIAGQQFKVEKDQKIFVHHLEGEEGDVVEFDKVLLIENDKTVLVGEPVIEGALVSGKILSQLKGDKVIVFKKKRRKGYRVKKGHRQELTQIVIEEIVEKGGKKKERAEKKKPVAKKPVEKETVKVEPKKIEKVKKPVKEVKKDALAAKVKKVKEPEVKKPVKKTAEKKPVTKKTTAKKTTAKKQAAKKDKKTK
jgi:large subunit ribosomal protein L21